MSLRFFGVEPKIGIVGVLFLVFYQGKLLPDVKETSSGREIYPLNPVIDRKSFYYL
jgi:hypothetical protein